MKTKLLTIGLKYFSLAAMVLGFMMMAGTAKAAPLSCASLAASDVDNGGAGPSITCYTSNITFSNFSYANEANDPTPLITLLNPQPTQGTACSGASVCLGLNPNLIGAGVQDLHLVFEVTSTTAITSVTLADTGGTAPDGISEHICDSTGVSLSTGTCNGTQLASMAVNNNSTASATLSTPETTIWVWKDINVGNNGHLSAFTQGFNNGSVVPEPMTLSMMGLGLLGLGVLGRRLRK